MAYTHLHVHSTASDGLASPDALAEAAQLLGYDALALSDHHTLAGHASFADACHQRHLRPLFGVELRVHLPSGNAGHALVLAEGTAGYEKLKRLVASGKRVALRDLVGIGVVTSACMGGSVARALSRHDYWGARDVAQQFADALGAGNYYIELQATFGLVMPWLISLARELSLPCVVTNDVHYLEARDAAAHGRPGLHLASEPDQRAMSPFDAYQEAVSTAHAIAERLAARPVARYALADAAGRAA